MVRLENFILLLVPLSLLNWAPSHVVGIDWVSGAMSDFEVVKEMLGLLEKLHMIQNNSPEGRKEILQLIYMLNFEINNISNNFKESRKRNLDVLFSVLPTEMNKIVENVNDIEVSYDYMMELVVRRKEGENNTAACEDFAKQNTKPRIFSIFSEYFGYNSNSSIIAIVEGIASNEFYEQELPISVQQYFYSDYFAMTILGIKEYLVKKFSWFNLPYSITKSIKTEEENFLREHENRMLFMTKELRGAINYDHGVLSKPDPDVWKENENYEQLTRLMQGYVVNVVNLNRENSCKFDCGHYHYGTMNSCQDDYCKTDESAGEIFQCESFSRKDFIHVCPSTNSFRRYEYVEFNRSYKSYYNYYGLKNVCPINVRRAYPFSSYPYICNYCFCLLDDKGNNSDRFFNLREVVSDVKDNKVVTGVRFIKKNRIIYLQIQQGELAPFGLIKENSTEWKHVEEYELRKEGDGVDYITLDNKRRSINLDDVKTNNKLYLVTGLRLRMVGSHLRLEVRINPYLFEMGKLFYPEDTNSWIYDSYIHSKKVPLKGEGNRGPNISTKSPLKSLPSQHKYNFVEFTYSDKISDAAQTTLPFIDTQDVVFYTPTPLSGVGLYHKGFDGYGGFIAPKIFALDLFSKI